MHLFIVFFCKFSANSCNKTRLAKRLFACKCCSVVLKYSNKSSLQKHKDTAKHKTNNYQSAKSTADITQFIRKKPPTVDEQIAKSELIIASYFSEHNVLFVHADHFAAM